MYNIIYETSSQSRFDARYWMLGAGVLGRPRGMVWGGRRVQDGEHMYTCGRFIFDIWQNQYNIVKLNKIKFKKKFKNLLMQKKKKESSLQLNLYVQSLIQEDPTCHRATKPMHHSY